MGDRFPVNTQVGTVSSRQGLQAVVADNRTGVVGMKAFACFQVKLNLVVSRVLNIKFGADDGLVLRGIMIIKVQVIDPCCKIDEPFPGFKGLVDVCISVILLYIATVYNVQ